MDITLKTTPPSLDNLLLQGSPEEALKIAADIRRSMETSSPREAYWRDVARTSGNPHMDMALRHFAL